MSSRPIIIIADEPAPLALAPGEMPSAEHLTPEERDEIAKLLAQDTRIFYPTPGPQYEAFTTEADIIGYGGAAGGGKSYLVCGLALQEHKRSVIFRQHKNQTRKFVQDFTKILGSSDGYSSQNSEWRYGEKLIEFGGLEDPNDHEKWQGRDHDLKCVGAGTPVWMADGSRKAIEEVQVNDMVETLEGPRRVTRTMSFVKPAVLVMASDFSSQVQGATHELLTAKGWLSAAQHLSAASSPTSPLGARISEGSYSRTFEAQQPTPSRRRLAAALLRGCARCLADCRSVLVWFADEVRIARENAIARCYASSLAIGPQLLSSQPLPVPLSLRRAPAEYASTRCAAGYGARDAQPASSPADWQDRCWSGIRHGGERLRLFAAAGLAYLHRLGGAEPRNPIGWLVDDPRHTPRRSLRGWSWVHPYTKEKRRTAYRRRGLSLRFHELGDRTLYDLTVEGANHYMTGAGFVNRNCYDEATQMREYDVRYTMGWNRSDDPNQRCRSVLTFNPPTTAEGRWVVKFFAPWLDPNHPNPAADGEIRWFTTIGDNQDYEVPDDRAFVLGANNELIYDFAPADYEPEEIIRPKSRTFITARVTDNPYYMATGYMQQLQTLPEPLRSQMLRGDFMAGVEDDEKQLIPTSWVEMAFDRYDELTAKADFQMPEMSGLGVDAARGGNMGGTTTQTGKDKMVISPRHDMLDRHSQQPTMRLFPEQKTIKGVDVNTGNLAAAQILAMRKHNAPVQLDVAGVGTSVLDALNENKIHTVALNNSAKSKGQTKSGGLKFANRRAEFHWRMREALDPEADVPCAIKRDPELLADLTAPRWWLESNGIKVEPKDDIKKRIGRSPDKGEALMYANVSTPKMNYVMQGYSNLPPELARNMAGSSNYDEQRLKELG